MEKWFFDSPRRPYKKMVHEMTLQTWAIMANPGEKMLIVRHKQPNILRTSIGGGAFIDEEVD